MCEARAGNNQMCRIGMGDGQTDATSRQGSVYIDGFALAAAYDLFLKADTRCNGCRG